MYKKILVPHAGTAAGDEALRHAIHAAREDSKIIILHIVEEIQRPPSFALSLSERENLMKSIDKANDEIKKDMEQKMQKCIEQCGDIESEFKVRVGDATDIILEEIENENIDLVVMAKRRKLKGMKRLLSLGSVSRKIVESITCPMILIDAESN